MTLATDMKIEDIPLTDIYCDNDFNCRGRIVPADVIDLVRSINQVGLQQPIVVQPYDKVPGKKWRIVSGHRRYTAFRVSDKGYKTIPAIVRQDLDDLHAKILNIEENLKRKDLNKLQEAQALKVFLDEGWTHQEIADELSMPKNWVDIRTIILELRPEIQAEIAAGFLNDSQIRQLKRVRSHAAQMEAVRKIKVAKQGGESVGKIRITPKKPKNPLRTSRRTPDEIFKFMELIQAAVGNNFATRCLGWAAGTVNDFEIMQELRDFAKEQGIEWEIPKEILQGLTYS